MTFVDDTHVNMIAPGGETQLVELSEAGLMAYQQTVESALWAQR